MPWEILTVGPASLHEEGEDFFAGTDGEPLFSDKILADIFLSGKLFRFGCFRRDLLSQMTGEKNALGT